VQPSYHIDGQPRVLAEEDAGDERAEEGLDIQRLCDRAERERRRDHECEHRPPGGIAEQVIADRQRNRVAQ